MLIPISLFFLSHPLMRQNCRQKKACQMIYIGLIRHVCQKCKKKKNPPSRLWSCSTDANKRPNHATDYRLLSAHGHLLASSRGARPVETAPRWRAVRCQIPNPMIPHSIAQPHNCLATPSVGTGNNSGRMLD